MKRFLFDKTHIIDYNVLIREPMARPVLAAGNQKIIKSDASSDQGEGVTFYELQV